jgi:uncharacterized protein (TIGR03067 family)
MRRHAIGLVLLTALAVPVLADDKGNEDEKLYGTWVATSREFKGETTPFKEGGTVLTFSKGGKLRIKFPGEPEQEGAFVTPPSKEPLAIDVTIQTAPNRTVMVKGIYRVEGNTLTVALGKGGTDRPDALDPAKNAVVTYKRQKP